jgi:hypothetical protein
VVCTLGLAAAVGAVAAAAPPTLRWSDPGFSEYARAIPIGGDLRIDDAILEAGGPPEALELERFRVFAPDARVVVHGDGAPLTLSPPVHAYFRGTVTGRSGSRVMLTVLEDGGLRGLIASDGRYWLAEQGADGPRPGLHEVTDHPALNAAARPFACDADRLPRQSPESPAEPWPPEEIPRGSSARQNPGYTVRVGVETDFEYYQLFGSTSAAVSYAGDLFGYASSYYTTEVGTDFWISHVSLWTTAADPWTETSSGCLLFEFGRYWNTNMTHVTRTVAHFLSGKIAGGGMSWTGVLCSSAFSYNIAGWGCSLTPLYDLYGGGYGFSGDLLGSFQISNPGMVRDIYEVSHELGHNFNTGHTHCYVPPVDQCYGQELPSPPCYSGPTSLPGPPGQGSGTIMSYCHLFQPQTYLNISFTLGLSDPWGYQSFRVPNAMSAYVATVAASSPLCLLTMFADGFESGDSSAWSSTVP